MRRDVASGSLLIAGSLAGVVVMALHPVAHGLRSPDTGAYLARVNVLVHALALAAAPMVFLGLLALWRRLQPSDLATAGLVVYAWGLVAVMSAAVASGFVSPGVINQDELLHLAGLWNQGFAKVNVVASSAGILLLGTAILRTGRFSRGVGVFGLVMSALLLALFFVGHIKVDVHGFGIVTFAQAAWLLWVGVSLCRRS